MKGYISMLCLCLGMVVGIVVGKQWYSETQALLASQRNEGAKVGDWEDLWLEEEFSMEEEEFEDEDAEEIDGWPPSLLPIEIDLDEAYGIPIKEALIYKDFIETNQSLSDILSIFEVPYASINTLAKKAEKVFKVTRLRAEKPYLAVCDSSKSIQYLIYEDTPTDFVVFNLHDTIDIYTCKKSVDTEIREASGVIESSLSKTLADQGLSQVLANSMSEVFAWSVNFFKIHKGDAFKIIYEAHLVEDQVVGVGEIKAAYFKHRGDEIYAIQFEQNGEKHYYDENGRGNRKAFLKAPLKYTRISSRFSKRRYHPVLKRYKGHFGTDYAAPAGTPIHSVADGVITKKGYGRGNGNYIKIKHDDTYSTQYLHMSKFGKGMRKGRKVKQGEVIGYVGSTGLATGPHLCFRFWKNGKQVDALKQKLPTSEPIKKKYLEAYTALKDSVKIRLDAL